MFLRELTSRGFRCLLCLAFLALAWCSEGRENGIGRGDGNETGGW